MSHLQSSYCKFKMYIWTVQFCIVNGKTLKCPSLLDAITVQKHQSIGDVCSLLYMYFFWVLILKKIVLPAYLSDESSESVVSPQLMSALRNCHFTVCSFISAVNTPVGKTGQTSPSFEPLASVAETLLAMHCSLKPAEHQNKGGVIITTKCLYRVRVTDVSRLFQRRRNDSRFCIGSTLKSDLM